MFKLRKIASALASTLMIGSTIGLAAATSFPQPFVSSSGLADVAIVYGNPAVSPTASMDLAGAVRVQEKLQTFVTATSATSTTESSGGDFVRLDKSNDKINLGDTLTSAFGTSVDKDDMSTLLADGKYTAEDNDDFDYEQKITLGTPTFTHFRDSDYEDLVDLDERTPTLGFQISSSTFVLNYTLDFLQDAESTVTSGDLDDFEGSDLMLFGQPYYVSDAKNGTVAGTFGKFTLLDAANTGFVSEGETVTVPVGSESYEVSAQVFSSTETVLTISGERTNTLAEGQTYKLSDGTFVGVKDILYVSKDTGVSSVEFSLGNGKIELTSGSDIKINDDTIEGVKSYFYRGTASSDTQKLDKVVIEWKVDEEAFISTESSIKLPGFETLELAMESWVRPEEEKITLQNDGTTSIELQVPVKDGTYGINLLYANSTGEFDGIGKSATERLATSGTSSLTFRNKVNNDNYHKYVIITYNTTDDAHSYILSFDNNQDTDAARNETTVKNVVTGDTKSDVITGLYDTGIGSASFTITDIGYNTTDEWVTMTAGTNTNFNTIYTEGGLKIWLPVESTANGGTGNTTEGYIYLTADNGNWTAGHSRDSFYLFMKDEDKDDNIAGGNAFNLTINDDANSELEVSQVNGASNGGSTGLEIGDSNVYETYIKDAVATRILHETSTSGTDSAEIYYAAGSDGHSQSYAEVFLKASEATIGGGAAVPILMDSEVSSAAGKNIVVVGGSCVNTAAAQLLGSSSPLCGADWTAVTDVGAGEYLIQTFSRTGSKVATLVAGYNAADTDTAATALTTQTVDTTAGMKYKGTTAENLEPVITNA